MFGSGCVFCSGHSVLVGFNDFASNEIELAKQWSSANTRSPAEFSHKSEYKAIWDCELGHTWVAKISDRVRGNGCVFCKGRQLLVGFNDVASRHPQLAREWGDNNALPPEAVKYTAHLKVKWVCELGHEWEAMLDKRARENSPTGCPVCSNRIIVVGFNDLATSKPEIAARWHPTKNSKTPQDVTQWSSYSAWWVCEKSHEYESRVASQSGGHKCHYCSGKYVLSGFNDLETLYPEVAKEWDEEKNGRPANMVMPGRNKNEWWVCPRGHEWQAAPGARTRTDARSCHQCSDAKTSKAEIAFRLYFGTQLDYVVNNVKLKINLSALDKPIQIDLVGMHIGVNIAIEYDGVWWHRSEETRARDTKKTLALLTDDYLVIRIREGDLHHLDLTHPNLFQINHKWSLQPDDIAHTGNQIMEWLDSKPRI